MAYKNAVLIALFATGAAHAKAPDVADQIKTAPPVVVQPSPAPSAPQNMQYHLQRLKMQSAETSGSTTSGTSQPQQYHQERLRLLRAEATSGSNASGGTSQQQQYHQERLKLLRQASASQMQYHIELLKRLSGAKSGKTADARLDGYLAKYLADVGDKGLDGEGHRVVDFGGCVIAATYANQSADDARATCAKAVGEVKVADVNACVKTGNPVRGCVTTAISTELTALAKPNAVGVQFAEAKSAPHVAK